MSLSRTHYVAKARKPQGKCSKCQDPINVGDAYLYWQPMFRSNYKVVRCRKYACQPKQSELETSNVSTIYAAIESAEDTINNITTTDTSDFEREVQDAFDEITSAFEEVKDEYQSVADEYFGGYGPNAERAEQLESDMDTVPQFSLTIDAPEPCEEHSDEGKDEPVEGCEACAENVETFLSDARQEAQDALSEVEVGV